MTNDLLTQNTVTLRLDGNNEEFAERYNSCQLYYRYWMFCNAAFRIQYGNRILYTTPENGTFYYVVRYEEHHVTLVIDARQKWLLGFMTAQGVFQMQLEGNEDLYMDTVHCELLNFVGNHSKISPNGTGNTWISLRWLQCCVVTLSSYRGPNRQIASHGFRSAIGLKVVLLLEAKFPEIFMRSYSIFCQQSEGALGDDWVTLLITNRSSINQQKMHFLDDINYVPSNCNIRQLKKLNQLLDDVFYLHLDGYEQGIFAHEPLPPAPRRLTWAPVDPGEGDRDIPKPVEPANHGVILCQNRKRILPQGALGLHPTKKRKGLNGGGLGGKPIVPKCFAQWQQKDDVSTCVK